VPWLTCNHLAASACLQFKTSADQLLLINPELAAGGTLSPGVAVFLPPQ
jgi:hypothetical protein